MEPYRQLEKEYAEFTGSRYAVSVNSGTSALHLGLLALEVKRGDEVIVPDFTMGACGFAVSYIGAKPVFVDVDPETYAMLPKELEKAITKKTKAIMPVHVYGRLAPMDEIVKMAKKHKIPVIEDACEAQGAVYKSKADVTAYSLYRNKIIASEEGGIVATDNKKVAERVAYLKNMAFDAGHTYFHKDVGYNNRLADSLATIALNHLHQYKENSAKRRRIEEIYNEYFPMPKRDAVWFYEARVPQKAKKEILKKVTSARESFKPLSTFPMYGSKKGKPNSLKLSKELILLPAHTFLSEQDIRKIAEEVQGIVKKHK